MDNSKITRAALGSSASIGDLYDARKDDFCGISIFKKNIPENVIASTDAHFSDIHLVHTDTFTDKVHKLDVSAELQVSVLAGLFTLEGSGRYLSDKKQSARTVKSSLIYNVKTKDESVNIYHEDLKDAFALDAINNGVATHVVVGISWGANSILSCFYENKENRDVREIGGSLSAQLKKLSLSISGKASVDFSEKDNSNGISFDIHVYGDILSKNEDLPTTFEGALDFMKQLPSLVATCNEGRGKPLTYHLLPLSLLQDYLKFSSQADVMIKNLQEDSLARVVQLFEEISESRQKLNDFYQDTKDFDYCVKQEELEAVGALKTELAIQETAFRGKLSQLLQDIRSGRSDVDELENLLLDFQSKSWSPTAVATKITEWSRISEKINLARALEKAGARYIGYGKSLDEEILKDFEAMSYVFYFCQDAKALDPTRWNGDRQIFFQEMNKDTEGQKYYAVDCDVHPGLKIGNKHSCVQVLQAGAVLVEDLLNEQDRVTQVPLVQLIVGTTVRIIQKPNKRVPMEIRCTGNQCHPSTEYEWICNKCMTKVEYGFDDHVYCECGKTPALCLEFKCTDPKHGITFERHEEAFLTTLLAQLRPFQQLNILILGETGVGKSTWINGFINFLTYGTLEDAEQGDLLTLIPSEFTVCDENFDEVVVSTGTDENETQVAGQSATQDAKVYPFNIGNTTIRLIDTPGIGDTRGIEQDRKNFENILGTLSHLEEIHGICILLKPNNARLTVMFRFCIKELLTYLHRDASKNIMFCFTNSRGTFYRPGDTMPALKKLLAENEEVEIPVCPTTVYCYDSEAYRFLAAVKNKPPVTFAEDERLNFSKSWEKSIAETKRMLKHIRGLPPHSIKSTLNLNHSRELVLKLSRPLAEISRNIQVNKSVLEDKKAEIEKTNGSIKDLEAKQMVSRTDLEIRRLDYPKTVCADPSCVKTRTFNDVQKTEYTQVCHDHCYLNGVPADTIGDAGLLGCYAITDGFCRFCGHSYAKHLHVYYNSVQVTKMVADLSMVELLHKNLSDRERKAEMIKAKNKEIQEFEEELLLIQKASVRFAYFLKKNAITPYNDALEQYMGHLIREEEAKVACGGNRTALERLIESRDSYVHQKDILTKQMNSTEIQGAYLGNVAPGVKEVDMLVKQLQDLKHSGKKLKDALECINHTQNAVYKETVLKPPRRKKGSAGATAKAASKGKYFFSNWW